MATQAQSTRIRDFSLIIIAAVAITAALAYTATVMVPFIFALFIFAVTAPIISYLQHKLHLHRLVAAGLVALLFVFASFLLWLFLFVSIGDFIDGASQYQNKILVFIEQTIVRLNSFGIEVDRAQILQSVRDIAFFSYASAVTGGVIGFVSQSVLVVIFVFLLLIGRAEIKASSKMAEEITIQVSKYIATKFATSFATGVLTWLILGLVGVDLAFMFGIFAFLLNFIPSIGSLIAWLMPLPIVLLQFDLGWQTLVAMTLPGAVQFTIGNLIEPKIMGEKLDLHPVAVLIFLIFWGIVWGVPGMFLAVPITAIVKIILSRIEQTKSFAELLGGRIEF